MDELSPTFGLGSKSNGKLKMARRTAPQQPEGTTTPEQALVTPAVRPEVLLALQHQQSTQAINNECASIRQAIGALKAQLVTLTTSVLDANKDVTSIKRTHHLVLGGFFVLSLALALVWWAIGSKVTTLFAMADERQVSDAKKSDDPARKSK